VEKNFLLAMGLIVSFLLLWTVFVVPRLAPPPGPVTASAGVPAAAGTLQDTPQEQVSYNQGYIQLALRTNRYKRMNARAINSGALGGFDGVGEPIIMWDKIDPTAEVSGYVFGFELTSGFTKVCYWSKERVMAHARKYSQAFRSGSGPWSTPTWPRPSHGAELSSSADPTAPWS